MGIYNINTIQNNVDTSYTDIYIKEALSNLGQRTGAKGDSISESFFVISDIISPTSGYCVLDDDIVSVLGNFNTYTGNKIDIVENSIGNFADYRIYKLENSYLFIGKEISKINEEVQGLLCIDFNNNDTLNIKSGLYIFNAGENIQGYLYGYSNKDIKINGSDLNNLWESYFVEDDIYITDNTPKTIYDNIVDTNKENIEYISETQNDRKTQIFNYFQSILPNYIIKEFNDNIFVNNSYEGLKKYILASIYQNIVSQGYINVKLYFDPNFKFTYFVNDNTGVIYYSYDFVIRFINDEDVIQNISLDYILCNASVSDNSNSFIPSDGKYENYRFIVEYIYDSNYVNRVALKKNYTLPYIAENNTLDNVSSVSKINPEKYWYINDSITNIKATPENAGNPNIMIISYTYVAPEDLTNNGSINTKVLYSFADSNLNINPTIEDIEYEETPKSFIYKFKSTIINNSGIADFVFEINLPNITTLINENSAYESVLQNCLLWTVIDVSLGENDGKKLSELLNFNTTSYITVFWKVVKTDGVYTWELINNPAYNTDDSNVENTVALDLGSLISLNEITKYFLNTEYEPDKYLHSYVVFDSASIKNTNEPNIVYPINTILRSNVASPGVTNNDANLIAFYPAFAQNNQITIESNVISGVNLDRSTTFTSTSNNIYTTQIYNDVYPYATDETLVPLYNFREVLTTNQTALNRISIVNYTNNNAKYHAYIGLKDNTVDVLSIGTSTNVRNMVGNKTLPPELTSAYTQYKKLSLELPVETDKLFIQKYDTNKYFTIISVDINDDSYISPTSMQITGTKYMNNYVKSEKKLNLNIYLNKLINNGTNKYISNVPTTGINIVNDTTTGHGFNNSISNFIIYLEGYDSSEYKYKYVGCEEIIKNTNYII